MSHRAEVGPGHGGEFPLAGRSGMVSHEVSSTGQWGAMGEPGAGRGLPPGSWPGGQRPHAWPGRAGGGLTSGGCGWRKRQPPRQLAAATSSSPRGQEPMAGRGRGDGEGGLSPQLNGSAALGPAVGLLGLPRRNARPPRAGARCQVAGWGSVSNFEELPRGLMEAEVRVLGLDACNGSWRGQLGPAMLCARSGDGRRRGFCSVRPSPPRPLAERGTRGPRRGGGLARARELSPSPPLARGPRGRPRKGGEWSRVPAAACRAAPRVEPCSRLQTRVLVAVSSRGRKGSRGRSTGLRPPAWWPRGPGARRNQAGEARGRERGF